MKKCPYCGLENPADAILCSTCRTELDPRPTAPAAPRELRVYEMSPDEQRFWEKMTFRQFAVLLIRLPALWLFFNALLDLTYLAQFAGPFLLTQGMPFPWFRLEVWMLFLRVALNAAAGYALIKWTDGILRWLMKDLITPSTPQKND
jgi:hypothetical protein